MPVKATAEEDLGRRIFTLAPRYGAGAFGAAAQQERA